MAAAAAAAAAAPVLPPEEVALLELGKVTPGSPPDKAPPAPDEHPGDAAATLPWDRCQHSTQAEAQPVEAKRRSSPEGSPEAPQEAAPSSSSSSSSPAEAEDEEAPELPMLLPHVFVPIDPQCIERSPSRQKQQQPAPQPREGGKGGSAPHSPRQKQVLLPTPPPRYRDPLGFEGRVAKPPPRPEQRGCPGSLRAAAAAGAALLLCPCLLYGAYVFLPFDAPLLPTVSTRLVYTLRCAAFATFPIVLGIIVGGISRLCSAALEPAGELQQEVQIHSTFVSQSVHLFILYFFNMAVLATYLPQEVLKLIPLLTALFAVSRLIHWLSYAVGRSFRAFGFSMTFLPLLAMLLWNLYSMFVLEPENLLAVAAPKPEEGSKGSGTKLRYWG